MIKTKTKIELNSAKTELRLLTYSSRLCQLSNQIFKNTQIFIFDKKGLKEDLFLKIFTISFDTYYIYIYVCVHVLHPTTLTF